MSLLHVDTVRRYLSDRFLCSVPEREGCVALTFDDGPNPRNTPALLDVLARKGVPATFFVLGHYVRRFPHIVQRASDDGHQIANHTDRHVPMTFLPPAVLRLDVRRAERSIVRVTGRRPRFLRPPMGWFTRNTLKQIIALDYVPVIGDVNPRDSRRPPVTTIVERVRSRLHHGSIVIFHDGGWRPSVDRSNTVDAVDRLTDELLAADVRFLTLDAMTRSSIHG